MSSLFALVLQLIVVLFGFVDIVIFKSNERCEDSYIGLGDFFRVFFSRFDFNSILKGRQTPPSNSKSVKATKNAISAD